VLEHMNGFDRHSGADAPPVSSSQS
jgi:hypothetical protein